MNEQLEPFQMCHPQGIWFRDVTYQMPSYQFQPTNNLYLPHIKWRDLTNEHHLIQQVLTNEHLRQQVLTNEHLKQQVLTNEHLKQQVLTNEHLAFNKF